jgi:hypothetical protein
MKRHLPWLFGLAFLALCASALAAPALLTGCGTLADTPDGSPVDWPDVVKCGPSVPDLVGTVSRVLLGSGGPSDVQIPERAHDELEDLARQHGPATVACLVDLLVRQWTAPGASRSPDRAGAAARGTDFLDDVGTHVDDNPAYQPPPQALINPAHFDGSWRQRRTLEAPMPGPDGVKPGVWRPQPMHC